MWDLKGKRVSHSSQGKGTNRNKGRRGESDTRASVSETCGPTMAPTSAARRSRGYGVRADGQRRDAERGKGGEVTTQLGLKAFDLGCKAFAPQTLSKLGALRVTSRNK